MADRHATRPSGERRSREAVIRIAAALARSGLRTVKLADLRAAAINVALAQCRGDRPRAAQRLGVSAGWLDFYLDAPRN